MDDIKQETWEEITAAAKQTVDALIARLPVELRPEALRVGYELCKRCPDKSFTLGSYVRTAPLITLYLEGIRDECYLRGRDFTSELERTYLHELGHHLGLDEEAVERLGV